MKKTVFTILTITIILLTNTLLVFAASKTELESEKNTINSQIDKTKEQISEVSSDISDTMKQVQNLIVEIGGYEEQINSLDNELSGLEEDIKEEEQNLAEAQKDFDKQKEMLENRIVAMYEAGDTTFLDVLLSSSSISDFISNYYFIEEIASYDQELLDQIEKKKNEIEEAKKTLEDSREKVEIAKENKEKTAKALKNSKEQKEKYASQLTEEEQSLKTKLEEMEEDKAKIQSEIDAIIARENSKGNTVITPGEPSSSGYIFPVAGLSKANINNKNYPSYSGHTGVDVNINVVGKSVVAVKSGTVEISTALKNSNGTYRSYGEYILINHHDGTMTLYAHMLAGTRRVTKGEQVTQGQVIGTVGSTGNSTGPHLHFEVRVNGRCTNPLPYLP